MSTLVFQPAVECEPGTMARLLAESYAAVVEAEPELWAGEPAKWRQFDRDVFEHPETVGACAFVSRLDGELVGLASFDPSLAPVLGVVGHNCILPAHRGRGVGRAQIREVLRRLAERGIQRAVVATSEHPFFAPARRMYRACGFVETRRFLGGPGLQRRIVEYEMDVPPPRPEAP